MGIISRGIRNAFRNTIRTAAVCVILGISIALSLVMLLSLKAVEAKIASVKSSIGNFITITPAGAEGFEGGGEPLTGTLLNPIKSLANVLAVDETLNDRLTPASTDTNLASPIDPGTLGRRSNRGFGHGPGGEGGEGGDNSQDPTTNTTFSVPIRVIGTSDPQTAASFGGGQLFLKSGDYFDAGKDETVALVGQDLAVKNNLSVGSSFQAYNTTIKVVGIFDAGSQFANDTLVLPLTTLQRLAALTDQVSSAQVQVDSIDNLNPTVEAIKNKLGNTADVVSQQDTSTQALAPLESVKTIATYSLFGVVSAGAVIIFLAMLMIVRERRREIGILKALGSGSLGIAGQFVTEAVTLTFISTLIGFALGFLLSNPILSVLLNNSATQATLTASGGNAAHAGGRFAGFGFEQIAANTTNLRDITTSADVQIILYALALAFLIAVVGSLIPAWLISKVRPSEVLRSE